MTLLAPTSVHEDFSRMSGRSSVQGGDVYVHVYKIVFPSRPTSVYSVLRARKGKVAIPSLGMKHTDNLHARVISVQPRQIDDSDRVFEAIVTFSTKAPDEGAPEEIHNPLERPPEWGFEFQGVEVEMVKDANDKPVLNSAGRPFQQQPTDTIFSVVMNVSHYVAESLYPLALVRQYAGAINTDQYSLCGFVMPAFTTRFIPAGAREHREGGITCVQVAWKFELRDPLPNQQNDGEQWDSRLLDCGYGGPISAGDPQDPFRMIYEPFRDEDGNQLQELTLLDGNGQKLDRPFTDEPFHLHFQRGLHLPFAALGLPS